MIRPKLILLSALALAAVSCGDDGSGGSATSTCFDEPTSPAIVADTTGATGTLTLLAHDSFIVSDEVWADFTARTGYEVDVLTAGDTGSLVAQALITAGDPLADVLFGIDNTFLCRGLEGGLFLPHVANGLSDVDDALQLDPHHRVTPIDFGDVCVNYAKAAIDGDPPVGLEDLTDPRFADELVTQNPETSSPGFAFLLATIAEYGDEWTDYWTRLSDNGVEIVADWESAYYGSFVQGGGDRSLVTSYASSPPAEVVFADEPLDDAPTASALGTCYRQIEFAGVLDGTDQPQAAAALVEFMLTPTFQADIPLNMFVYPANREVDLPAEFVEHGEIAERPYQLDPVIIEQNRDAWIDTWIDIVS